MRLDRKIGLGTMVRLARPKGERKEPVAAESEPHPVSPVDRLVGRPTGPALKADVTELTPRNESLNFPPALSRVTRTAELPGPKLIGVLPQRLTAARPQNSSLKCE